MVGVIQRGVREIKRDRERVVEERVLERVVGEIKSRRLDR